LYQGLRRDEEFPVSETLHRGLGQDRELTC
jgi:hypothetical protein